jgi:hypothetical protein
LVDGLQVCLDPLSEFARFASELIVAQLLITSKELVDLAYKRLNFAHVLFGLAAAE